VIYVDAWVVPVPRKKLGAYKKWARISAQVWKDLGALLYLEALADDVKPGKWTSFPQSVKLKRGEIVVVAFVTYKSRKDRNRIMKAVMTDKRLEPMMDPKNVPFDGKRMFWGGFKTLVAA
jgi:uncharacterized protein YbaA (DUF1428 family)